MVETQELIDTFPAMQHKDNQGLTPPRATDPGWAHGTMVNGGRQKIKCKYCHKVFLGGGISRLKQHLAGERGNVAPCEEVPDEVKLQIQQHLGFKVLEKLKRQKGLKSGKNSFVPYFEGMEEGDDDDDALRTQKPPSVQGTSRRRGKQIVEGTSKRTKRQIGRMDEVNEILVKAKRITQFIYNNAWVLNLMRKKTGGRDILQLSVTRFTSIFLTLENIVSLKDHLHQVFTGTAWIQSSFFKQRGGVEVAETIVDPIFWLQSDQILKVTKPLLSFLHLMDCEERPSVGYIFDAMEKAKKTIIMAFDNNESEFMPYFRVIDLIWQEEFHSPLHAAAYYLNPSVFYKANFSSNKVIQKGLLDCIETLEPDISSQVTITSQINSYEEAVGDFGRPVALRGRESLAPGSRISSTQLRLKALERNHWLIHWPFLYANRRAEGVKARSSKETLDPICLEAMDANIGDWVEDMGSVEGEDLSWMDVTVPCEQTLVHHEVKNMDDSIDSSEERSSDGTKGIDESDDL
ncbi:hypothetical protein Pint_05707 [Pistacia integerrima]|uniref:Uncharacterized protein n=1 Tax=Pistacia integerrima TaxID=434235 RepID=A0ACC0Z8V7_9ROSI|nr:hypothetical protein Pint_05707 [Pistacia integerrima]